MNNETRLYTQWLNALENTPAYKDELDGIKDNQDEIIDRFYKELTFGTAGLRGLIGLGTNRMNEFTVGKATQGLANYILKHHQSPKVAIGYDSRNFSPEFAQHAAEIFSANGIQVYIHKALVPTPVVAFTVADLGCDFGVVITASHNPAAYNGYKVFNSKACQIDDDVAESVMAEIGKLDIFEDVKAKNFDDGIKDGSIKFVDDKVLDDFKDTVFKQALQPEICKNANINMVYTPLNGTGGPFVTAMLNRLGVENLHIVKEQAEPDGNFPTCPYPNPEFKDALELALKLAKEVNADFLLATDPDADRVSIAVLYNGEYEILSGHHLGVLLLNYIASTRKELGTLPKDPLAIRSIVTTRLTDEVAKDYGVTVKDVLTGFKFVGEVIENLDQKNEKDRLIFAYEEACGFLIGTHVRDKDAVVTSLLVTEMMCYYKSKGINLIDVLEDIYSRHGYFSNMAQNLEFKGAQGMEDMTAIMAKLRDNPPKEIVGRKVVSVLDYKTGIRNDEGTESKLDFRSSNVLEFHLDDGCAIIIRPSGTEPKLKLYYNLIGKTRKDMEQLEKEYAPASVELAGVEA